MLHSEASDSSDFRQSAITPAIVGDSPRTYRLRATHLGNWVGIPATHASR
jgi:hypothetical protein